MGRKSEKWKEKDEGGKKREKGKEIFRTQFSETFRIFENLFLNNFSKVEGGGGNFRKVIVADCCIVEVRKRRFTANALFVEIIKTSKNLRN